MPLAAKQAASLGIKLDKYMQYTLRLSQIQNANIIEMKMCFQYNQIITPKSHAKEASFSMQYNAENRYTAKVSLKHHMCSDESAAS